MICSKRHQAAAPRVVVGAPVAREVALPGREDRREGFGAGVGDTVGCRAAGREEDVVEGASGPCEGLPIVASD